MTPLAYQRGGGGVAQNEDNREQHLCADIYQSAWMMSIEGVQVRHEAVGLGKCFELGVWLGVWLWVG